jgi:hypothetical protein
VEPLAQLEKTNAKIYAMTRWVEKRLGSFAKEEMLIWVKGEEKK